MNSADQQRRRRDAEEHAEDGARGSRGSTRLEGLRLGRVEPAILVHGPLWPIGAAVGHRRRRPGSELPARGVDVDAPVAPDRRPGRRAPRRRSAKRVDAVGAGCVPAEPGRRVERDQVHVRAAAEAREPPGERVGLVRMVVDAVDARVLERDPPALGRRRTRAPRRAPRRSGSAGSAAPARSRSASSGACSETASVTGSGKSRSRCMPGTTPTVDTVR